LTAITLNSGSDPVASSRRTQRCLTLLPVALSIVTSVASAAVAPNAFDPAIARVAGAISKQRLEQTVRALIDFGTRHTLSDAKDSRRGVGAAREWIRARLEQCSRDAGGRLRVDLDRFVQPATARVAQPTDIVNVVATLDGVDASSRDRTLVVSGHYDSMCGNVLDSTCDAPGANDDASGTAVVVELACVMARERYPATLVFLAVAGEEQGLLGSAHWAKTARERNANVEAMITNDIVGNAHDESGRRDARYVRLFSEGVPPASAATDEWRQRLETGGENDSPPRELARAIQEAASRYVPEIAVRIVYRRDRYLRGGDHIPFLAQGYAAVRFTEAHEDYRHQHQNVRVENGVQYGDLPQFVDFDYLAQVARVNAAALASLASAPRAPAGVRMETVRLENQTTLVWRANVEPVAGYEILWRETTAPLWQGAQFVGDVTRATVPLSKDDYIFSVRAVGKTGHRSLASYPLSLRTPTVLQPK
jgi:hypothetical protein